MKVVLISEHASPLACIGGVDAGGQNIYVSHVARCLAQAGHQVDVLTRRDDPSLPAVCELPGGARVVNIDAGPATFVPKECLLAYMPEFAARSVQYLQSQSQSRERGQPDIVHANFFMSGIVAEQLQQRLGIPYVITFHALGRVRVEHQKEADGFPKERGDIEQRLAQSADRIIAECPQDQDDLMRLYGASRRKLSCVPCGFDASEFSPMDRSLARRKLGLDPSEFIVLQLGRMVPRKGIDNAIEAIGLLGPEVRARLLVVGGDAARAESMGAASGELARLRLVAERAGASSRVNFVGHRQRAQLRDYYAASDVFVTTPWYEPFGITPLEAMACARPVIGSEVGGIKHSVVDGVTGLLVPPRRPDALAERLTRLHRDPAAKLAMGLAGLKRVQEHFTWEQVAAKLADIYSSVVHHRELSDELAEAA